MTYFSKNILVLSVVLAISCQANFQVNEREEITPETALGRFIVNINQKTIEENRITTLEVFRMVEDSVFESYYGYPPFFSARDTSIAYLIPSESPGKKYVFGNNPGETSIFVFVSSTILGSISYPALDTLITLEVIE